ncbi:MAG: ABC transporter substrate binding protein [Sideroxydans sp.]|nr:ABC transporter substrate binding protein [Sideroxydans sp.]
MCCLLCFHTLQAAPLKVSLALDEDREAYLSFESALRNSLDSRQEIQLLPSGAAAQAELIVAIGSKTVARFSSSSIPVLNVMVSRIGLEKFRKGGNQGSSGIYMDQPTERQFSLLRAALPQTKSIGVLISNETPELVSLRQLSIDSGLNLNIQNVPEPNLLASRLTEVLSGSDVLLVLPDAAVYRSDTIRNILLETYRRHVPMIGLSQNYVRAGALCAVYSTPRQVANQAARIVAQFSKTRKLPDYQYPQEFEVAVNTQVARSLGLTIKSADELRNEIGGRP